MTAPTHISFATMIYLALMTSAGVALNLWNGTAIALASLLPDIDTGASAVGRLLPSISRRIERRFGHRTLTHSLPFTAALALCLSPLVFLDRDIYVLILVGYASHPLLDSCTITGVRLLYPISNARCVFPMDVNVPSRYRIATGGQQEWVLCAVLVLLCIPAFLVAHQGFARFVRVAQGNIESAVRDYCDFSRSTIVWVQCRAHRTLSKESLEGRFEVVGDLDAETLLIKTAAGELHTLGKEYRSEYVAEHAVCEKGEPSATSVERFDMTGRSVGEIPPTGAGEVHLFGSLVLAQEVRVAESQTGFSAVSGSGREICLSYATSGDLSSRGLDGYRVESGWLTVRRIMAMGDSARANPHMPQEIHESARLQAEDILLFSCSVGDTLSAGDQLAVWELQGTVKRELEQTELAIAALETKMEEDAQEFRAKSTNVRVRVFGDSIAHQNARRLYDLGFLSAPGPHKAALEKGRTELELLDVRRRTAQAEMAERMRALVNRQGALRARLLPRSGRGELKAKAAGVVAGVDRIENRLSYSLRVP